MRALVAAALLALSAAPAAACTIALGTDGTLALSPDGQNYASTESGAHGATLTILNVDVSAVTFTVSAPALAAYPPGFNAGGAQLAVSYMGGGLLSPVNQPYTAGQTSFSVPALMGIAALLTLQNRITSTAGFPSGTYQTKVTVTCS